MTPLQHPKYNHYLEVLKSGAKKLKVAVTPEQLDQLIQYVLLLDKWNKAYNLSAIRNVDEMLSLHVLDSLSISNHCHGDNWIDVGTGGGLPGVPLAILYPEKKFTLLDSNGKKTRFLFQVKTSLKLDNLEVVQSRVEDYKPEVLLDVVVSRAFASIKDMVEGCKHLLNESGQFYAMKGVYPEDELSELPKPYKVSHNYPLKVPTVEGERHLIVITSEV
ncbi:MAG: 16S rRNA (guanine(527)-N(7))-methyltransferase RsmG [Cellvibrionaceae bacterium]